MGRFLGLFFCGMAGLFVLELLPVGQRYLVAPLTVALTHSCAFIIELLGRELLVDGILIIDNASGFTVQIAAGCNGVEAMILLIAAIVAFPAPWRYKLGGLILGLISIQLLNIVRIVSLFYLGIFYKAAFEWAHLYIWQALIMLDTLLVWMVWIRYIPERDAVGPANAPA